MKKQKKEQTDINREKMGRLTNNPEQQTHNRPRSIDSEQQQIHHFSHQHVLQLSNHRQTPNTNISCSACKLTLSGSTYSCLPCNYFLHISCSQKPKQITHPFDQNGHVLFLLPVPLYPEGAFGCDACGKQGTGFSYHCGPCGIDLHINCASMPLFLTHNSHLHKLDLTFSPPYHNKSFGCDICKMAGFDHWLYRCQTCEFDAHLDCAMGKSARAPIQRPGGIASPQQSYPSPGSQYPTRPPTNNFSNNVNPVFNYGPVRPNVIPNTQNNLINRAMQEVFIGASQAIGQNLVQGLIGGGSGGGTTYYSTDGGVSGGAGGVSVGADGVSGSGVDGGYTVFDDSGIQESCDTLGSIG